MSEVDHFIRLDRDRYPSSVSTNDLIFMGRFIHETLEAGRSASIGVPMPWPTPLHVVMVPARGADTTLAFPAPLERTLVAPVTHRAFILDLSRHQRISVGVVEGLADCSPASAVALANLIMAVTSAPGRNPDGR